ncbi:MAG: M48 family peptidase, partial [Psychroserpens sp.]|nr:M48 family peptidase [Psychroserpens sp.]
MNATQLYYLIIAIIIIDFVIDKVLNALNAKHYNDPIPDELNDVY